jgi:hypothetical protein
MSPYWSSNLLAAIYKSRSAVRPKRPLIVNYHFNSKVGCNQEKGYSRKYLIAMVYKGITRGPPCQQWRYDSNTNLANAEGSTISFYLIAIKEQLMKFDRLYVSLQDCKQKR